MPNNVEQLTLKGFKRVNEFADTETLEQTELTKLENMILDSQGGKAVKRGGFSSYNANSAGGGIYSLHDVVDPNGANLLLAVIGTKLKKSTSGTGTWSDVKTGLTSNLKSRLVSFNDKFFLSNDTDAPYSTDGTSVWSLGLSRLDVSTVASTSTADGRLTLNAKYKWMIIGITNLGEYTPPSRPFTHYVEEATNNTTNGTNQSVTFSGLPVSSDSRIVSRYLFRTKADGETFYLCARLDNVVTAYLDDKADTELDLSLTIKYNQAVSTGKYIEAHNERLFLGNVGLTDDAPLITHANSTYLPHGNAANLAGGMAGVYTYKLLFVDEFGRISSIVTTATVDVSGVNDSVKLWNLPTPPNASVECRLYRNAAGGATFYYVDTITGNYFFDDMDDITLAARAAILTPTSSSTAYPSGVIFSEIGKPAEISPYNIIQVFPDDADEITGLIDDGNGLIVIKKNSICKIFTNGNPLNWRVEKLFSQIGCDQPNSIQKIGDRIYFVNNKQVYRYPDFINAPLGISIKNTLTNVSSIVDAAYSTTNQWYILLASLTSALTGTVLAVSLTDGGSGYTEGDILTLTTGGTLATVRVDTTGGGDSITSITLLSGGSGYSTGVSNTSGGTGTLATINITTVTTAKRMLIYDEKLECWYHFYSGNQTWECIIEKVYGSDRGTLITGHTAVNILTKYNTSVSVDNDGVGDAEITALLRSKTFTIPEATSLIRLRKLFANYKKKDGQTVSHILYDPQKAILRTGLDTTNATDSTDYKDYEVVTDAMTKTVGTLNTCRKLYYEISGYGLTEFNVMKLFYRIINRGSRAI